jgi:hypothetical protein
MSLWKPTISKVYSPYALENIPPELRDQFCTYFTTIWRSIGDKIKRSENIILQNETAVRLFTCYVPIVGAKYIEKYKHIVYFVENQDDADKITEITNYVYAKPGSYKLYDRCRQNFKEGKN